MITMPGQKDIVLQQRWKYYIAKELKSHLHFQKSLIQFDTKSLKLNKSEFSYTFIHIIIFLIQVYIYLHSFLSYL